MSLPQMKLDDRQFQDIVDEAKRRIAKINPEWTDHNVSDPGITLIELFAWMTEMTLYRLNQVPQQQLIAFLDKVLGIQLDPPKAASVPITFWLSKFQPNPIIIPAGTEVATTRTETSQSIIFTTNHEANILVPKLIFIGSGVGENINQEYKFEIPVVQTATTDFQKYSFITNDSEFEGKIKVFQENSSRTGHNNNLSIVQDATFYYGFENDLSYHILGIKIGGHESSDEQQVVGMNPEKPPYRWEALSKNNEWIACEVDRDTTKAMVANDGEIRIFVPKLVIKTIAGKECYWIRVRFDRTLDPIRSSFRSPEIVSTGVVSWGITTSASQLQTVRHEYIGTSDGSSGQKFQLNNTPILDKSDFEEENDGSIASYNGLTLYSENDDEQLEWRQTYNFSKSKPTDHHFMVDYLSGQIRFGPAIRQQDGRFKQYGAIPDTGSRLIVKQYTSGGGANGNVLAGAINTRKSAIPFINKVENRVSATGGQDHETLDHAIMRGLGDLRSRYRAVTKDDFEFLADHYMREYMGVRGFAKCLFSDTPNQVTICIAVFPHQLDKYIERDIIHLPTEEKGKIEMFLQSKAPISVKVEVANFEILRLAANLEAVHISAADARTVAKKVYQLLNMLNFQDVFLKDNDNRRINLMRLMRYLGNISFDDIRLLLNNQELDSKKIVKDNQIVLAGYCQINGETMSF